MRFMARLNALTYPDADQSATTRPVTNASPAAEEPVTCSTTGSIVFAALAGTKSSSTFMRLSTICSLLPTSPRIDTRAKSAGAIAKTA